MTRIKNSGLGSSPFQRLFHSEEISHKWAEDTKESYAIAFAELFLIHREKTEEKFFQVLKEVFTDEEVSELLAFICFTTAQQYFGALMDLK
ncbi:hypothetical protein SRABI96_02383 [Peribacillus sp. Bi96]|uniref:hypothetical protein n=1 Tax=unclassified Peribacillus TaxID=2675266 RepID=UPI001D4C247D|nr:hypothetical protein [Peribacillus sp. Bi96]CAH0219841.1 hypothetical protein SRABI96_02383 [Peribacillus sp. Bi96]